MFSEGALGSVRIHITVKNVSPTYKKGFTHKSSNLNVNILKLKQLKFNFQYNVPKTRQPKYLWFALYEKSAMLELHPKLRNISCIL